MSKAQFMTQAAYSRHRGVSRSAVAKAVTDGRIVLIDGRIDPAIADAQWQNNTRARSQGNHKGVGDDPPEALDYGSARARREHAEATMAELQLAEKTGSLLNRRGVELAMDTGIRTLRDAAVNAADQLPLDHATRSMVRGAVGRAIGDAFKIMPTMLQALQPGQSTCLRCALNAPTE
jgi:hypothetical protein